MTLMSTPELPRSNCLPRLCLLAILAVFGLGLAVAAPQLNEWWLGIGTTSAADDVVAALKEGRALALGRSRVVRVEVEEDLRSISVEGGRWRKLSPGIALSGPKREINGKGIIMFRADGSSTGGQVVVSLHGRAVSILVDTETGRIRRVEAAG